MQQPIITHISRCSSLGTHPLGEFKHFHEHYPRCLAVRVNIYNPQRILFNTNCDKIEEKKLGPNQSSDKYHTRRRKRVKESNVPLIR